MGLAAAIAAITLLPSALLVPGSVALKTHTAGGAVRPLSTLRTIVFPDWWGRPSGRSVPAPSNFTEGAFYVGAAPLLLALIGLFGRDRWRAKAPLAAMVGLGLAVPLGVHEHLDLDGAHGLQRNGVQVLLRHALPNALLPVVTLVGSQFGTLLTGAVLTEIIFAWPGIGRLLYDATLARDYPLLMGIFLLASVSVIAANLIVDLLYAWLDPRVRLQ